MRYDKLNRRTDRLNAKVREGESELAKAKNELAIIKQALDSTLHEVRRLSGEISTYAEELSKSLASAPVDSKTKSNADTVFYLSGMISSRLAFTDLELNPTAVVRQQTVRSGIYKKFDKASHILQRRASIKSISVRFMGNSRREIETLPAFELVPFVLLENAIKYSPANQQVLVKFDEQPGQPLYVTIDSLGPIVFPSEIDAIFERGVRGQEVKKMAKQGTDWVCTWQNSCATTTT